MRVEARSERADVELVQVGDVGQKLLGSGSDPERNFPVLLMEIGFWLLLK